tara:strand:+ start:643 stop:918 length:276 start_codon:yes stop_codon:yes gene_type:complete
LLFLDINEPKPSEIKDWMKLNGLSINEASDVLGISKRQFARILSGETKAKRLHSLAMQMVWLINENKKQIIQTNPGTRRGYKNKSIKIPIK